MAHSPFSLSFKKQQLLILSDMRKMLPIIKLIYIIRNKRDEALKP